MLSRFKCKPLVLSVALSGFSAFAAFDVYAQQDLIAQDAEQPTYSLSIAAIPLSSALNKLAQTPGVVLSFDPDITRGKTAQAIRGDYSFEQALRLILEGTGLSFHKTRSGSYVLRDPSQDTMMLQAVKIDADVIAAAGTAEEGYVVKRNSVAGFGDQDILDTPFSVKVIPSDLLSNRGIGTIAALDRVDASVTSSEANSGWYARPNIRGLSLGNISNYRYNGQIMVNQQATALENKQSVEVLKGLSALQAGFSTPGGIINYVTKRPVSDPVSTVNISANEHGNYRIHTDISRSNQEAGIGIRLNVAYEEEKSYIRRVDGERNFFSLAADWQLADETQLFFDAEYEKRNQTAQAFLRRDVNGNLPEDFNPRIFLGQRWGRYPTEYMASSSKLSHSFNDDWTITIDANWTKLNRDQNSIFNISNVQPNGDGSANFFFAPDQSRETWSFRASTAGTFSTGFVSHELTFGVQNQAFKSSDGGFFWGSIGTTNIYNPIDFEDPRLSVSPSGVSGRVKDLGFFINDSIQLSESWTVQVGGRYADREEKSYDTDTGSVSGIPYKKTVFTPSAAVVFKPDDSVSTYVSYAEGLQNGGEAPQDTTNAGRQFPPLVSEQWEAGVKSELSDRLVAEAALFLIEIPAQYTRVNNDGSRTYVQEGLSRHQGLELSLTGRISEQWVLLTSAMWLDAELAKTNNPDTEGNRPSNTPKERLSMTAEYTPAALANWTFYGSWVHTGDREGNAQNSVEVAPSYDIFGLGARYETHLGKVPTTFQINADNIFDERYWATGGRGLTPGAARTVSASVSFQL